MCIPNVPAHRLDQPSRRGRDAQARQQIGSRGRACGLGARGTHPSDDEKGSSWGPRAVVRNDRPLDVTTRRGRRRPNSATLRRRSTGRMALCMWSFARHRASVSPTASPYSRLSRCVQGAGRPRPRPVPGQAWAKSSRRLPAPSWSSMASSMSAQKSSPCSMRYRRSGPHSGGRCSRGMLLAHWGRCALGPRSTRKAKRRSDAIARRPPGRVGAARDARRPRFWGAWCGGGGGGGGSAGRAAAPPDCSSCPDPNTARALFGCTPSPTRSRVPRCTCWRPPSPGPGDSCTSSWCPEPPSGGCPPDGSPGARARRRGPSGTTRRSSGSTTCCAHGPPGSSSASWTPST
jgi:hypothetical protein